MLEILQIDTPEQLVDAFEIRRIVFVGEQACAPEEEYDGHDDACLHLLAVLDGKAVGTARIRSTEKGKKLERFAVLAEARSKGVGKALVFKSLELVSGEPYIYLHSQEHALGFYEKLGFKPYGERFWEANIPHIAMRYGTQATA